MIVQLYCGGATGGIDIADFTLVVDAVLVYKSRGADDG
jgi:hypothetical protein